MKPLILSFFLVILAFSLLTNEKEEVKEPKKLYQQENAVHYDTAPKQHHDSILVNSYFNYPLLTI
ncbi:MAG: hypothetical protein LBQ39_00660 [Tannerellaceae bacterium]|jgi:hypothetical protein|nr:hypothetical protein [Tannerellaceae bacterium]